MRFEFGEGHFNRIEVGAVGGQEQEPATAVSQGLCGGRRLDFVGGQIVEDDNGARIEGRSRLGFDTGVECRAVDGPGDDPGRDQCVCVSPAMNVCVPHLPNGATP